MKMTTRFFTALLFALTTMPGFCDGITFETYKNSPLKRNIPIQYHGINFTCVKGETYTECINKLPNEQKSLANESRVVDYDLKKSMGGFDDDIDVSRAKLSATTVTNQATTGQQSAYSPEAQTILATQGRNNDNFDFMANQPGATGQNSVAEKPQELRGKVAGVNTEKLDASDINKAERQRKREYAEAQQELNKEPVIQIENSAANMYIGASISFSADIANNSEIREAFDKWKTKCTSVVKAKYENAEAVIDTKGTTPQTLKKTCLIAKCDEAKGFKISNDKKSCVKTAEQKKFEKEYSTENNKELQNTVNKIAESTKQMKGGTVLTYDAKFKDFDGVLAELAKWEDACDSINTDDIETAEPSFDYSDSAKVTATCEIVKCKKTGYQPSQDKKSCVKESFENGEECTPDSKQYRHAKAGKFDSEKNKCIPTQCEDKFNLVDDECISDNKKDRMDKKDVKNDTKSFDHHVKLLADAFDSLVKTKTDECTKKQGTIKDGECEEPVATARQ